MQYKPKGHIMLIITRRCRESIYINDNIKIIHLGLNSWGNVKLGIEAPTDITVYRSEIYDRILAGIPPRPRRW